jgi:CheY-like chemotaxis protein
MERGNGLEERMNGKRVLVVEDNPVNMKLVRILLTQGGYEVTEAADAERGLAIAGECLPDLVLMDVQLPGMDGLTATRRMRNDARMKDIKVIALTSFAMAGDEEKVMQAGCDGYLTKPIDTRAFLATIARYTG